jgi:hypothetical protein
MTALKTRIKALEAALKTKLLPLILCCDNEPDSQQQAQIKQAGAVGRVVFLFRQRYDTLRIYHGTEILENSSDESKGSY